MEVFDAAPSAVGRGVLCDAGVPGRGDRPAGRRGRLPPLRGPLYQANYERKPRGGQIAAGGEAFTLRYSLCCGREGCRKRATPPSLRFLGRKVYLEAVVLLASVVTQLTFALRDARALTGVPGRTLRRWAAWWTDSFPRSSTWVALRARFRPPPPDEATLPVSLLVRLAADASAPALGDVCQLAARLLAPATTLSVSDGSRFVRGLGADPALA